MREEIVAGIKIAMQRGSSLEQAMQSFINAGYSENEVREAGKILSSGVTEIIYGEIPEIPSASSSNNELPPLPAKKIKKRKWLIIGIILIGIVILGLVGFLIYNLIKS